MIDAFSALRAHAGGVPPHWRDGRTRLSTYHSKAYHMKKSILFALMFAGLTQAASAEVLLSEGFDDVPALAGQGWIFSNGSVPPGPVSNWFQGSTDTLSAHQGAPEAYIASNYLAAEPGGILNNWLVTPEFSTATTVLVSFWLRAEAFEGTSDQVRFGFSDGSADLLDFALDTTVTAPTDAWTRYTIQIGSQGSGSTGRFGFQHFGIADLSNYVGLDTLTITAVPEPSTAMILGLGLAGFAAARRRRA